MLRRICYGVLSFASLIALFLASAHSAFATQADNAKLGIVADDPAVDPNPPVVNEVTSVSFLVKLYSLDDQNVEQPAANVKRQSYTLTLSDDGGIQEVIADGFTVTVSSDKTTATIVKTGGNNSPSISVKAKLSFSSAGDKAATLSGTVTFNDDSTLSATKTISFKVTDIRVTMSPKPIVTIVPFKNAKAEMVNKPTRVTATVVPASATNDVVFIATPIPLAFPPNSTRFTFAEVSRDVSTGKIQLDIILL